MVSLEVPLLHAVDKLAQRKHGARIAPVVVVKSGGRRLQCRTIQPGEFSALVRSPARLFQRQTHPDREMREEAVTAVRVGYTTAQSDLGWSALSG